MSVSVIYQTSADDIPICSMTDKCIVLDLDQTLIATQEDEDLSLLKKLKIFSDPKLMELRKRTYLITIEDLEKPGIGSKYEFWGVTRPHINEFLMFCFSYFKIVAVWSAGKKQYVEELVKYIFKDIRYPHAVFTFDDTQFDKYNNVNKPLTKFIDSDPILKQYMTLENTFALDDNFNTFIYNPGNGVLLPEYKPAASIAAFSRDDPTLLQFKSWLLQPEVMQSKDVTTLNKENIFKTYPNLPNQGYHFK